MSSAHCRRNEAVLERLHHVDDNRSWDLSIAWLWGEQSVDNCGDRRSGPSATSSEPPRQRVDRNAKMLAGLGVSPQPFDQFAQHFVDRIRRQRL